MRKESFEPIINEKCRILILGTLPSEESMRKRERYGHKTNQFWRLIFTLFGKPLPDSYEEKNAILSENNIAIWDVLHSAEGKGSLDSNLKNEVPNDFTTLFKEYPQIKYIFFTGTKAAEFYRKYVGFDGVRTYITLPSPSAANARLTFAQKLEKWQLLLDAVREVNA
ncbi:hypoxanthine-DNA glycosylase [Dysgonomonas sp. PFB1-18]|uniref:DNA-deoxyinosine glycosylase n=1 Tax=unclassified Dysgonomonas TaxID=2630389 RepID=UPI0024745646|nr:MULTISPECIES: DNA-deoxyinosine glycosylase [unclassified Dysgonomonas]MDH6307251.1 hypoxanthine-DNA glycosylase [Dysgonomonas sp. PF1-14]MDH6337169.1 hypoxanthine-DNA glycosylase [Dysgonomonas sp. PF1-16]MDH6379093.1 hypoxanthine-DNA glycosylase [Dysgonomonas sp. PFB1-18]MDH6396270.1 hypoxanthine-DNA glycosylase [Dysgonomonas sp. PF1-23]